MKRIDSVDHPMQKTWMILGYDTAWVPPHCGMVPSGLEEDCVWNPERIIVLRRVQVELAAKEAAAKGAKAAQAKAQQERAQKTACQRTVSSATAGRGQVVEPTGAAATGRKHAPKPGRAWLSRTRAGGSGVPISPASQTGAVSVSV